MNKFKICFIGDEGVGKTSIITRFIYESFDPETQSTVGVDFLSKTIHIENQSIRLQLWDTAGQERFRCLLPSYIRNSSLAVLVFDVTNQQSFENLDFWLQTVKEIRGEDVIIFYIGNKTDLKEQRKISTEDLKKKAEEKGFIYFETSAKSGFNIKQLFQKVTLAIMNNEKSPKSVSKKHTSEQNMVDIELDNQLETEGEKKKSGCC
ncbi:ras and ef-hand domain-containing protein [Anaeramoeba flamelloides]|uniref:Ras and ef-hand domain-containing protein n=1 Tax=Anaeramoeba flamelloides TaxID=1746091 RepID=A0AAV7YK05_9EUKA|nr:ras and ef-hand domain-containing protein [Anaeramoeba flamelloides]|eukprot:Anaeramoba_flamelloidesc39539_g1_i3.p1 GENE.c39539_g1_i3~~c39539_g1_i3.p1  ORF type:complete len:206 (+),score=35.41 c39539_g1_i3:20-637(+)